jgi:hypothetical protein
LLLKEKKMEGGDTTNEETALDHRFDPFRTFPVRFGIRTGSREGTR